MLREYYDNYKKQPEKCRDCQHAYLDRIRTSKEGPAKWIWICLSEKKCEKTLYLVESGSIKLHILASDLKDVVTKLKAKIRTNELSLEDFAVLYLIQSDNGPKYLGVTSLLLEASP